MIGLYKRFPIILIMRWPGTRYGRLFVSPSGFYHRSCAKSLYRVHQSRWRSWRVGRRVSASVRCAYALGSWVARVEQRAIMAYQSAQHDTRLGW